MVRLCSAILFRINEAVIIGFEKSLNAIVDEFVGSGVFKCHHGQAVCSGLERGDAE